MTVISVIASIAYYFVLAYFLIMWARFVFDLARNFARQWRPRGFLLVLASFVYLVTDPPLKAVRRVIPPLRMGPVALDFGWSIVMLVVLLLLSLTGALSVI
jgi:YggT family protein